MVNTSDLTYKEVDPAKKDCNWANDVLKIHRMNWRPLVNVTRGWEDRNLLYSTQPLDKVKDSFQDEEFKNNVQFHPLPILEASVNAVVEEITKNPPKTELKAIDPTSTVMREEDILLLKNRKIVEQDITNYQKQVGIDMDYKIPYDAYNGNAKDFDKMGLNDQNPEDVQFYEENFQKLNIELAGQSVLDHVLKYNKFDEATLRKIVKDVFAFKVICTQIFVDKTTGEIKSKYIDPQITKGVFGDTNDGKNDICRGWEDNVTVMEWLGMVGNEFQWDRDWKHLLWAINYRNNVKFTGFIRNNVAYDCMNFPGFATQMGLEEGTLPNLLDWSMAYTYKIYCGYAEWKSVDATQTYLKSLTKPEFVDIVPYSYELKKKKEIKEYYKESYYQQQWYSTYFIATTSMTQWIYGFQKVYFQQLEGSNDEYSNGTLCYYQEEGKSAVEIAKPYLQPANFAYYRMLWLIYKTKPDAEEYLLDELLTLSKGIAKEYPQMANGTAGAPGFETILNQIIQYQRKSHIKIRAFPEVEGRVVPQLPALGEKKGSGGLDTTAIAMQAVTQWAEAQISLKIGINPMRLGANPPSRESTESENSTVQYSFNTTGYMYRMVQYLKEHAAIIILNYTQDIIKFKDSLPYNWLVKLVGNESIEFLKTLDKCALHRYGLFINDYNRNLDKQRVMQAADIALSKGTLTQPQWFVINTTEDPRRANAILMRMEREKDRKEKAFQMQQMQVQDQMAEKQFQRQMAIEKTKGDYQLQKAQYEMQGYLAAAQVSANSKINVKELQIAGEIPKVEAKTDGQKQLEREKSNLDEQQSLAKGAA